MSTAGPNAGGTFASDNSNGGTVAWANPGFAVSDNAQYATATEAGMGGTTSEYLKITNFGFSLPAGAVVSGIEAGYKRVSVSGNCSDNTVKLVKGGTVGGTNNGGVGIPWNTSEGTATYGSTSDLWGQTWLYSDINASNFGIVLSVDFAAPETASVNYVYITVTYTVVTITATGSIIETTTSVTRESHIVAGGRTLILTVTGDTWVASGATFDAQRQNIIDGIDSAQAEANGWDAEVKAKMGVSEVVRTSNTVVTITLAAQAGYNITAQETITATVPGTALSGGSAIVASPTFRVVPDINRITHLGGLGIGREEPPRKLAGAPRAIVPAGMRGVR